MDRMAGKREKFSCLSWQNVGNMTAKTLFSCNIVTAFLSLLIAMNVCQVNSAVLVIPSQKDGLRRGGEMSDNVVRYGMASI